MNQKKVRIDAVWDAIENLDWYSQNSKGEMVGGAANAEEAWVRFADVQDSLKSCFTKEKLVYIPYRKDANYYHAISVVMDNGDIPMSAQVLPKQLNWPAKLTISMEMIKNADAIWLYDDWNNYVSERIEHDFAMICEVPVYQEMC